MASPPRSPFRFRMPRFVRRFHRVLLLLRSLLAIAVDIIVLYIRNRLRPP
ncbi:MAG: hypothetical protein J0L96_13740 [Anaerolineae bacterium]|nr:hypothetical protein [Anaerolineae bacterium]MCB0102299.1 hypothetical protein [Anaerolineales bacterium]